ncbi:MAG TPA: hypothetical protein VGF85_12695 [Opitutaceae bacterium]
MLRWRHESAFEQTAGAESAPGRSPARDPAMSDLAYVAASVGFFVLCALYSLFCEEVR